MKAAEIVKRATASVEETDRIDWRVGVTNDCERIFKEQRALRRTCYPADDYKEAKAALAGLLAAGFNGINATLPLADFKQVYLYEIAEEHRYRQAYASMPASGNQADYRPATDPNQQLEEKPGQQQNLTGIAITVAVIVFTIVLALSSIYPAFFAAAIAYSLIKSVKNRRGRDTHSKDDSSLGNGDAKNNAGQKNTLS